jgi:hypothetical protein
VCVCGVVSKGLIGDLTHKHSVALSSATESVGLQNDNSVGYFIDQSLLHLLAGDLSDES